jgi:hypothetical protein
VADFVFEEDFFGEDEGDASALLDDFLVLEALLPLVPLFLVLEPEAAEVEDFFFEVELVEEVVELPLDWFLFAHAVTNASAANTVIMVRAVFFIAMG